MNNPWIVLPITIPMLTGALVIVAYRRRRVQRVLSVAGAAALLVAALWLLAETARHGMLAAQMGNWPAPYGITLAADLLSALMLAMAAIIGLAGALYSVASIDPAREGLGYHAFYHFLLMGVCGAFLTGDLFNLYVWFEVMLMASFVLMALGGERGQMEGAIKYVTLNLLASAIFLAGVGTLYGVAGTLNMADLAQKLAALPPDTHGLMTTLAMFFLVAFGIKAAVFPLYFWLPASYHTPPPAVSAVMAGLLTKVGVYALLRVFTLIFVQRVEYTHSLLLVVAGLTMVTGSLGALVQAELRRVLSFQIVSHIGYMIMGLGLFTPLALAGAVFYALHHMAVITSLFVVSGIIERLRGTQTLERLGGLYRARPALAALFLVSALSLSGLPPLSGFFAKLGLVQAGLQVGQGLLVGVALGVGLLTLYSMMLVWQAAFWKPAPEEAAGVAAPAPTAWTRQGWLLPAAGLTALTVAIGLGAGPLFALALRAGEQLMDPAGYIAIVLGGAP
jgi:multicomponent Na+:H+ antiporter subunit D